MKQHATLVLFSALQLFNWILSAQPVLVKDIRPGNADGIWLGSAESAISGNTFYFTGQDGIHGTELWKSDGTAAGTEMVRDIYLTDALPGVERILRSYNGQLYFMGQDINSGIELWRTTEGPEGAILFRDACPDKCGTILHDYLIDEFQGKLFFKSYEETTNEELWISDGTVAGTHLFKDIDPGLSDSRPGLFAVYQDKLYFVADSSTSGLEPWVTDGTPEGTHSLKEINPSYFGGSRISGFKAASTGLYFFANNNANGLELWKTDGSSSGTSMVKDIAEGENDGIYGYDNIANTMEWNGKLLFIANDGTTGRELWATEGSTESTALVKDIHPGSDDSDIFFLANLDGKILFEAQDGTNGTELWITDGSSTGTRMLKNINAGSASGLGQETPSIVFQNRLYFTANNGSKGRELWVSDGTEAGTKLLYDINSGSAESNPSNYQMLGTTLMFFAKTAAKGRELWKLDLSTVGTREPVNTDLLHIIPTISHDGVFQVSLTEQAGEELNIRVYDAQGRECANQHITSVTREWALTSLPAGVYFVHASSGEQYQSVQKIVIY